MNTFLSQLHVLQDRIKQAEQRFGRPNGSVTLMAVSKTRTIQDILLAHRAGLHHFGENYLQEALPKLAATKNLDLTWHFIGTPQSNKARLLAEQFAWVHSVNRLSIAESLNALRPTSLPPLNICIQLNVSLEPSKSGITPSALPELVHQIAKLPRLKLRGLMCLPAPSDSFDQQRIGFAKCREAFQHLKPNFPWLDTLSMGSSHDFEAAIAEGATIIRIGTTLFGKRPPLNRSIASPPLQEGPTA